MWLVKVAKSPYFQARWDHPDGSGDVVSQSTKEVGRRAAEARGLELEAAFIRQWKREQSGSATPASRVIEEYWETEAEKLKSGSSHIFPHLARITKFLGDTPYGEVTIAHVARFVDELDGTVSDSTINRAISVWRRVHNVAAKKRLYPVQIIDWSQVRRLEPEARPRRLTREQTRAILEALPEHARHIVLFALATGARKHQIVSLTWDRVNIEAGTATIWRKHRRQMATHDIALNKWAIEVLLERKSIGGDTVFDATNLRKHWEAAAEAAGVPDARFHDLRHTAAYQLVRASPAAAKEQLGHSDIKVTMRYAVATPGDVRNAVESTASPLESRKDSRQRIAIQRPFRVRPRTFTTRTKRQCR